MPKKKTARPPNLSLTPFYAATFAPVRLAQREPGFMTHFVIFKAALLQFLSGPSQKGGGWGWGGERGQIPGDLPPFICKVSLTPNRLRARLCERSRSGSVSAAELREGEPRSSQTNPRDRICANSSPNLLRCPGEIKNRPVKNTTMATATKEKGMALQTRPVVAVTYPAICLAAFVQRVISLSLVKHFR